MDVATENEIGGEPYPLYIRKLAKKSVWGDKADDPVARIEAAWTGVFPKSESKFSLYRVESGEDLQRVVVALNVNRQRPNDQFDLVSFRPSELEEAGVSILNDALGDTECHAANLLHVDVEAGNPESFLQLCRIAIAERRESYRVKKSVAKMMVQRQMEINCESFGGVGVCGCRS